MSLASSRQAFAASIATSGGAALFIALVLSSRHGLSPAPHHENSNPSPDVAIAYPDTGMRGWSTTTTIMPPVRQRTVAIPTSNNPQRQSLSLQLRTTTVTRPLASPSPGPVAYRPPASYLDRFDRRLDREVPIRLAQDPIGADEDLLLPDGPTTPSPQLGRQPPTQPPNNESVPQRLPDASPQEPVDREPDGGSAERPSYDPNAPPSADEDLLQDGAPQEPSGDQVPGATPKTTFPPAERIPTNPDPEAPREALPAPRPDSVTPSEPPSHPLMAPEPAPRIQGPALPPATGPEAPANPLATSPVGGDPHAEVFADGPYPSAKACSTCHKQIYEEWAVSSHAYSAISPMFHRFEQTVNGLTQGTMGYFCMRCHAPVATSLQHPREAPIYESVPAAREGVTCVVCHRVREEYGKVNGERRIEPGSVHDPVYGSGNGEGLAEVLAHKDQYKVKTEPGSQQPGQDIHSGVIQFEQLSSSHFCVSCHQVAVFPGIALEVVWNQYRASPAHAQGIACQECHMGQEPGLAHGYTTGPVAIVNEKPISPHRKHSNHLFYGPGYSIAHPGVFPHNPKADEWTVPDWLQFDWRAGWGTEEFEERVDKGEIQIPFPKIWSNSDERMDAREILDENLKVLQAKKRVRRRLMENSTRIEGPFFAHEPRVGKALKFHYRIVSLNSGHNLPSGSLGAQPQLWLNAALTGPNGQHLWESGYVDANGDIADVHSHEVAAGRIGRDTQLVNLQTKFLITHVKGTDREMALPINFDIDQLPFIRPSGFPITVLNHPPFIRMEAHSIPPLGARHARYRAPAKAMFQPGQYRLSVRMRFRAEPIYFMRLCRCTPEMEQSMNEWMLDFHEQTYDFYVR